VLRFYSGLKVKAESILHFSVKLFSYYLIASPKVEKKSLFKIYSDELFCEMN
jgi:hypothetical protein